MATAVTGTRSRPAWSIRTAIGVLLGAAALLAVLSEILVGAIEPFIETFGLSAFFVGVVLIPTIGNLAEHLVAVQLAFKDKMEFAMAVTYGSSLQVALFVAPVLVLLGLVVTGQPMDLVFTPLEVAAVAAAVGISALIALDGESNWLEGALLTIVYVILAVSFFEFVGPTVWSADARATTAREGIAPSLLAMGDERSVGQAAASSSSSSSRSSSSESVGLQPGRIGSSAGSSPSASAWATSESAACCAS